MTVIRKMLLGSSVLVAVGAMAPAMAQEVPAGAAPIAEPQATEAEEITVTGSRIRSPNLESVSPVIQVSAAEFAQRGTVRAEDLLNQLPNVFAAQGAANSNEATGTAQVDLRGLSPSRTLVLVNGRRLPYGSPKNIPSDVNQVPTVLIQSVDVLTGGASAAYGSDAIAGVVNFRLQENFEGLRLQGNISAFQHTNDRDELRDLVSGFNDRFPGQYLLADESVWNGFSQDYSIAVGTNFEEGRGNVTAYASYRNVEPILQKDYDYSACALGATGPGGSQFTCSGSANNAPANLTNAGRLPGLPTSFRVSDNQFVPGTATYNFAPANYYQRPDERYMLGAMAHYELTRHFTPYVEAHFMDDRSIAQIAPGNNNGGITVNSTGISGINCDNPFLSAQQAAYLCTSNGLSLGSTYDAQGNYIAPESIATGVLVARRNVEGGNRQDDIRHTTYRIVVGTKGELFGPFRYDLYGQYANVGYRSRFTGDANRPRTANAFYAVRDQRQGSSTFGQIVCKINADANPDNNDANCAPLDYFGPQASQEAVDYIAEFKSITGDTSLTNIVLSIDGNLADYGIVSPFATTGVGVAFGLEYRKNTVEYLPDEIYQNAASPEIPISGSTVAKEAFFEINVPVVEDRPFFELLSLEGAYRYSDYDTGFTADAWKVGGTWSPVPSLRIRSSYQRAVRAPNVIELFSGQSLFEVELTENANGSFDPCSGATPFASFEACARTGVTAAQYGNIVDNPAGQFNSLIGGNPDLDPEVADTFSVGAVFRPDFVPSLTVSIDYFDINVKGLVGSVNPNLSLVNCLNNGDPFFCNLIQRNPGSGSLFQGEAGFFRRFNVNTGSLRTSGIDVAIDYRTDLGGIFGGDPGSLAFNLQGTYLGSFETTPLPNSTDAEIYECKGLYGGLCGRPRPEWRHRFTTTWQSPFGFDLALAWRHVSSVSISQTSSQPVLNGSFSEVNRTLGSRDYFDLSAAYRVRQDFTIRLGVNNLFDKDPPLTTSAAIEDGGNGNTYPQFYDAAGRYVFLNASIDF
ncbi:TonB-dependent receptor domain-containing protein [Sphingomonas baiyangensis]|uniref:TonB-dependent receptor n=1 Tax=Sphingomonas baiyangensis TaxID=2572576 RepID=A0A4U1KZW0_9SPHN|nr:TonB-dependent receptor [Sphingomonas baiyangensis]TKD49981.1 TonB-dependent receptor [Sphingomonas baiyangensis]